MWPGKAVSKSEWGAVRRVAFLAVTFILGVNGPGARGEDHVPESATRQQDLISAMKGLEKALGFGRTKNFQSYSDKVTAFHRCYYTGKLELPESYDGLHLREGNQAGCDIDQENFDVFFYPIEAVANAKSPVTVSLAHDSTERFLVVIPHEDFHESKEFRKLPSTLTEAASTLVGFLTASELARQKFGEDSEVYRNLSRDPELFLRKAEIVNRYHAQLSELYAGARSAKISRPDALALKEEFFRELRQECRAISPDSKSFNKCLAANNNAGLSFDRTYTKYYPLMYNVSMAKGRNLLTTIDAIKRALTAKSESEAVLHLQEAAEKARVRFGHGLSIAPPEADDFGLPFFLLKP